MAYEYITQYSSPNFTRKALSLLAFGRKRTIDSITIHHWGVKGQRLLGVVNYLCRKGGNTSAHYVVEAGRVACIVAPENIAWHAGSGKGNATSVGIECRPEATDADYITAAELIRELREAYGDLPLVPHRSWKATACPGDWDLARLDRLARDGKLTVSPVASVKPAAKDTQASKPKSKTYTTVKRGSRGATVKAVQKALKKQGYTRQIVDSVFGAQTEANVRDYQKRVRLVVDGIAGPITQKRLGL